MRACGLKRAIERTQDYWRDKVTPHAGVWIETGAFSSRAKNLPVTPHAGVWIETFDLRCLRLHFGVTPHAGVWIETFAKGLERAGISMVTPHAGVWIETHRR